MLAKLLRKFTPCEQNGGDEKSELSTGTVKWFGETYYLDNDYKHENKRIYSYGFIKPHGREYEDVYFHYTEIVGNTHKHGHRIIKKNKIVSFELCQGPKGLYAKNVRKLGKEQKL